MRRNSFLLIALFLGIAAGLWPFPASETAAKAISEIFINLLKLVSLPIIFLSIVSTASGMDSPEEVRKIGRKVLKYTLFTTIAAALIALLLFVVLDPARGEIAKRDVSAESAGSMEGYLSYLLRVIPDNIVKPFSENSVIGVLLLAILFSLAILTLPRNKRKMLNTFFSGLYAATMVITKWIIFLMPPAIWGFVTLFIRDLRNGLEIKSLAFYLLCVVAANILQAAVVLPLFLKFKGLSPVKLFRGMFPALTTAFFAKSSSAALPHAIKCMEAGSFADKKIIGFSMPLCTTINMNACAAFILITVLFVAVSNGAYFSLPEMALWIIISTVAAVGNAGVPMGCYFISGAFLAAMNVPLNILGIILPFYALIDMLESAINVWSDSCVTSLVHSELSTIEAREEAASLAVEV